MHVLRSVSYITVSSLRLHKHPRRTRGYKLPCLIASYELRDSDIVHETLGRNDLNFKLQTRNSASSRLSVDINWLFINSNAVVSPTHTCTLSFLNRRIRILRPRDIATGPLLPYDLVPCTLSCKKICSIDQAESSCAGFQRLAASICTVSCLRICRGPPRTTCPGASGKHCTA